MGSQKTHKKGGCMARRLSVIVFSVSVILFAVSSAFAFQTSRVGIRGGLGTDINLGLGFGLGGNILLAGNPVELGGYLFKNHSTETSSTEFHEYEETTDILVFALLSNYLINYVPGKTGSFFTAGAGAGIIMVDWEEKSETDTSLGEPWNGGSMQSSEGSAAGFIFSLGWGMAFSETMDFRLEAPIFVITDAPGESSAIAPTFIATLGVAF
jgi:hypothetical protein